MKLVSFLAALLVLSLGFLGATVYAAAPGGGQSTTSTTCQPTPDPFAVTQVAWGLSGAPLSVSPGDQDVPLTVTLLYAGPCTATASSFELSLSQPFTSSSGQANLTTYEVNLAPDTIFSESYYLNVNSSAPLETYALPLSIGFNTSSYSGLFFQTVQVSISLRGSVELTFSSNTESLYAGATNNLTISITNSGSGTATSVMPMVSTTGQVAILNQLSQVNDILPNTTITQSLRVFVPSSITGSAVSLSFSASYYDAYSIARSVSQTLGYSVSASTSPVTLLLTTDVPALAAGGVNNVTVWITNAGSGSASSLSFTVSAPSQIAILNQLSTVATLGPGGESSQVLEVFVPSSMAGSAITLTFTASYVDSQSVSRTTTQSLGFYVLSSSSSSPFVVQGVEWGTAGLSPQPGDKSVPLLVTVQYLGSASATSLKATMYLPNGFTDQNSNPTAVTYVSTVIQDQSVQLTFYLDLGSSLTSGSYSIPLELEWATSSASGLSENLTVSPPAIGQQTSTGVALSLAQTNDSVVAGESASVSFVLKNVGADSVFSPSFSLTLSSPLVMMGSLPTGSVSVLSSGESVVLNALVSSSPSSTPGVYGGTLTVSYSDLSGNQHTQNFAVGFVLTGSIEMVLQDVVVTQTSSSVSVSGSILNEGSASAYYSSVLGSVGHSPTGNESADYVGEIDPNTPTPFSITIPYRAPTNPQHDAQIAISVSYRNSFGTNATFTGSTTASLESAEQLFLSTATTSGTGSSAAGGSLVTLVSYAIIGVIVIAALAGAVVVRRRRVSTKPKKEDRII